MLISRSQHELEPRIDFRQLALTGASLAALVLVGFASSRSLWSAGGPRRTPSQATTDALAAAVGVLAVLAVLFVWVKTPTTISKRRLRRPMQGSDLDDLDKAIWGSGKAAFALIVAFLAFAIALLPLEMPSNSRPPALPIVGVNSQSEHGHAVHSGATRSPIFTWLTLSAIGAFAVFAPLALFISRRRTRFEAIATEPDEPLNVPRRDLVAAIEAEHDPRIAIRLAYARMEELLARVEVTRADDETPSEFAARALRRLRASGGAAQNLTDLFEQARFSDRLLTQADRAQAIEAVKRVDTALRTPDR